MVHLEFVTPFMPEAKGQGRGNSGCYLQGRYEVQILDSFGLAGEMHECGGIYSVNKPKINMCFPPLSWQTYDIEFTAARFDSNGKKTSHPKMTVYHNGVLIHENQDMKNGKTLAAPFDETPEPQSHYLQWHDNVVHFRNIWVVER